jgi:hypothetical protein
MYLTKINGSAENDFLESNRTGIMWIGFRDLDTNNTFKWEVDNHNPAGVNPGFLNWNPNQPDHNGNCAFFGYWHTSGWSYARWTDGLCTNDFGYVCEASDFSKPRLGVVDQDGVSRLSYWVESFDRYTQSAAIWIRVPDIAATSTHTLYLRYGPGERGYSSIDETFIFGDDFEHRSLDSVKWTTVNTGHGTFQERGGLLRIWDNNTSTAGDWWTSPDSTAPYAVANTAGGVDFVAEAKFARWGMDTYDRVMGLRASAATNSRFIALLTDVDNSHATTVWRLTDGAQGAWPGNDSGIPFPGQAGEARFIKVGDAVEAFYQGSSVGSQTIDGLEHVTFTDTYSQNGIDVDWVRVRAHAAVEPGAVLNDDAVLVDRPAETCYLSHVAAGQGADSPAIDAGTSTASALGLDSRTTRTDRVTDTGAVDLGYHYLP